MPPDADHFQVSWHNLSYAIEHQTGCYERAQRNIARTVDVASKLFNYSPSSRSYNLKESSHIEDGPKEDITILRRSNGSFRSGQLTAVMGPSGAGKTSLLNFVTRRQHEGFTGNLIVSQAKRKMVTINAIAQTDHLAEYLTVRENLAFASRLKNPTMNSKDHDQNVARVSSLLGLNKCLETKTKQISGGQQKRLAIAQELLSKPDILILDEPTSGLDSVTCLNTLTVLKDLVKASADKIIEPIAIVLTIHQPQREAFELFDKVYVMATGGVVIYDGPPSKCKEFIDTYSGLEMPEGYNPASFLIEIASGQFGEKPIEAMYAQVERKFIADHSGSMERATKLEEICGGLYVDPHLVKGSNGTGDGHFLAKTLTLAKRCTLGTVREPNLFFLRLFIHISIPMTVFVMMGSEPGKANACPKLSNHYELQRMAASDEYTNVERQKEYLLTLENVLMLYNMVYACVITKIGIMSLVFILDMRSSLKEFNNGWYSMNAYLLARVLADLPMDLILPTITFTLTYWLTGQVTGVEGGDLDAIYRILLTSFVTFVGSSIGQMVGMMLGALYLDDVSTALFVSQAVSLPLVMISGVVVKTREMSPLVGFFSQLSVFRHCLDVTYIIRYGFNLCGCRGGSQDIQFVGSDNVTMTGVPEAFRSFTKLWVNSQAEESSPKADDNSTTTNEVDVFELIAKQVSQYNTYGVDVKSCKELVPFQMYDFNLSERDLAGSFQALLGLHLVTAVALVLVVNLLVRHKSSL